MTANINNYGVINFYENNNQSKKEHPQQVQDVVPIQEYFRYITPKCISEKRAEAVEAEISAACKGTAEGLWRTLWNNENLGFVVVQPIDATTLYRDIEKHFGKLPYSDRQFRAARNKR